MSTSMSGNKSSGQPPNAEPAWNARNMLDVHILDYLKKRNLHETATAFQQECKMSDKPCAIEAPSGFLFEWWSIFWDIYISRTNPSFSACASTYSQAQKAKAPMRQQQLQQLQVQQQVQQQQHSMLQQQLMREKNLRPEDAAQYAQQIMAGRIRISELAAVGNGANQEHGAMKLRDAGPSVHNAPFQGTGIKTQMDEAPRGSVGSLPSPGLEARGGALDPFQRQQLLAAFQSAQRSANQANLGPGPALDLPRGATPLNPLGNPSTSHSNALAGFSQPVAPHDTFQPALGPTLLSPSAVPPELRQQAIQKLQQQYLQHQQHQQQQGTDAGSLQRRLSADLSGQPASSRQSSGTMQRYSRSPTMPPQHSQPALNPQQMMLLQHMQQHQSGESHGAQLHVPESEVQRRLLAQLSSRGLLKPGPKLENADLSGGLLGQDMTAGTNALLSCPPNPNRAQQLMLAELRAHHHQQQQAQQQAQQQLQHHALQHQQHQARPGSQMGMLVNSQAKMERSAGPRATPTPVEMDHQMPSSDSGHHRNSPASSTAGGSTLQTGRATPAPINSSARNHSMQNGGKPANGVMNKKRKHNASTSPSNSESQETPSSNASGGAGCIKPVLSSLGMHNSPLDQVAWGQSHLGSASLLNSTGSGMNAAAAALNDCTSDNILSDFMGEDALLDSGLDTHLLLSGDGDPTDASFLG